MPKKKLLGPNRRLSNLSRLQQELRGNTPIEAETEPPVERSERSNRLYVGFPLELGELAIKYGFLEKALERIFPDGLVLPGDQLGVAIVDYNAVSRVAKSQRTTYRQAAEALLSVVPSGLADSTIEASFTGQYRKQTVALSTLPGQPALAALAFGPLVWGTGIPTIKSLVRNEVHRLASQKGGSSANHTIHEVPLVLAGSILDDQERVACEFASLIFSRESSLQLGPPQIMEMPFPGPDFTGLTK